ncbi:hypothetical protein ACEN32_06870 [Marinilactibacillus psychrotolerans]|uniref:hypothetical protein n=1 Tax=Marinilactibacillus psychrotolerans TaxID=191770 RepID=UPI0038851931
MFGKFTKLGFYILSYLPLYLMLLILNFQESLKFITGVFSKITAFSNNGSSYLNRLKDPLKIVVSVSSSTWFFIILFLLIVISVVVLIKFFSLKGYKSTEVSLYSQVGEDIMSYVVTYLTPLLSIDIDDSGILIVNLILFGIIGIVYTKNNLIYLNPVFIVLGYNVLRDNNTQGLIITNYSVWDLREYHEDDKKVLSYKMDDSGLILIKKQKSKKE